MNWNQFSDYMSKDVFGSLPVEIIETILYGEIEFFGRNLTVKKCRLKASHFNVLTEDHWLSCPSVKINLRIAANGSIRQGQWKRLENRNRASLLHRVCP